MGGRQERDQLREGVRVGWSGFTINKKRNASSEWEGRVDRKSFSD